MSVLNENQLIGASGAGTGDYEIEQSLRFNKPDTAYLSHTPSGATNQKTWTWSGWVKKCGALNSGVFDARQTSSGQFTQLNFNNLDILQFYTSMSGVDYSWESVPIYRDPSAWYHIVAVLNTSSSTQQDRFIVYVNGVRQANGNQYGALDLNVLTWINSANPHSIGRTSDAGHYFDGYMAEVNFIDGQALTPDSFGETGDYGEWKPIAYAGGYGTNGFYLKFENASSLGNDAAGSNNWTIHNLAATDQMVDSPTNNFATFNPLNSPASAVLSEGNLKFTQTSNDRAAIGNVEMSSGKWYYEVYYTAGSNPEVGLARVQDSFANSGATGSSNKFLYITNGTSFRTPAWTTTDATGVSAQTSETILGFAVDADNGKAFISVNGTYINSGNPATGANPQATFDSDWLTQTGGGIVPFAGIYTGTGADLRINFGSDSSFAGAKTPQANQDSNGIGDFFYPVPNSYLALCTKSLAEPDVIPSEHFNTVLYTGTGAAQSITTDLTPDLVWMKPRSEARNHRLVDQLRGNGVLSSNTADAEAAGGDLVLTSTGFNLTSGSSNYNGSAVTYVAWNWKAGGSASTLTTGTIDSVVSANPSAGFSIVKYVGNNIANATIAHGLSQTPTFIITKNMTNSAYWATYLFNDVNEKYYINASSSDASTGWITPASALITLGANNTNNVNESGSSYINYCFHSVDGYSRVGEYTGNGNADGPFVNCGFRPKYVLIRRNLDAFWNIFDTERGPYNVIDNVLWADGGDAETTSAANWSIDFLSNGFKQRGTHAYMNSTGETFFFLAFAESPFKHTNAR